MKHQQSARMPQAPADNQASHTRAAEALVFSEVRYRRLFEAARDGILILDADTGEIVDVNPFLVELLGLSREKFLGKEVWEIGTFKDIFASKDKFMELKKVGYVRYDNLPLQTVEGRKVQVEFVSNVYLEGRTQVIQCNIRNITERNRASEEARKREQLLSESQKLGHVGSWFWNMAGPISWSEECYRIYGVSPDTFIPSAESLLALIHPEDRAAMQSWISACAAGAHPPELEYRINRPDGTTRIILGRGELAHDAEGRPSHMAGTVQDITERKRGEEQIEQNSRFPSENPNPVLRVSNQGILIYANAASAALILALNARVGDPVNAEWQERIAEALAKAHPVNTELQVGDRMFIAILMPVVDQGYVNLYALDITERKRAIEALRDSHRFIEGIINTIPVRVFWKNRDLTYLGCNTLFAQDAGFATSKDIVGKDDYQMAWHDQAEKYRTDDRQIIESGLPKLFIEESQTTPEGNTIYLVTSKTPMRSANGEIIGLIGMYLDITELKLAEEARKNLQAQFAQAQKMESVGRLAGGVAHDFNNLLTAINGYAGFVLEGLPKLKFPSFRPL